MERSKYLYNLIKSLSKQEKRYLKVFANTYSQSGDKKYLQLFDAIEKQKEYDEDALKDRFRKEGFVKQFPVAKNYLYNLVVKNMLAYGANNNIRWKLRNLFNEIAFLHDKGLLAECKKTIRRTKKLAYQYEQYLFILQLITWEMEMFRIDFDVDLVKEFAEEEDDVLEKIRNYVEYRRLKVTMFGYYKKHQILRKAKDKAELDRFMEHPLLKDISTALSTDALASYYFIHGFYQRMSGNFEQAYKMRVKHVAVMEEKPEFITLFPEEYVVAINNVMSTCRDIREHEKFYEYLDRLGHIDKLLKGEQSEFVRLLILATKLVHEPAYYYKIGNVKEGIEMVEAHKKELHKLKGKVSEIRMLYIYFSFMRMYVCAGDYHQALHWNNVILNNFKERSFPDYIIICRFMQLIIHFELGNTYILESLIRSTYRYLYKRRKLYKSENLILQFLRDLTKVDTREQLIEGFKKLRTAFHKFGSDSMEKNFFSMFDFDAWLESKISGSPFPEVMKQRSIQ